MSMARETPPPFMTNAILNFRFVWNIPLSSQMNTSFEFGYYL